MIDLGLNEVSTLRYYYYYYTGENQCIRQVVHSESITIEHIVQRKTGSSGEYLGPRGMRMGSGEGSTIRNFIVCTVHLI